MADPHVITALEKKRSELAGDLKKLDKQRASIRARIDHVDAALKEFGYNGDPAHIAPRIRYTRLFKRNELKCMVRDYIRLHGNKASNRQIAAYVCERKGWNVADPELLERVTQSLKVARRAVLTE